LAHLPAKTPWSPVTQASLQQQSIDSTESAQKNHLDTTIPSAFRDLSWARTARHASGAFSSQPAQHYSKYDASLAPELPIRSSTVTWQLKVRPTE